MSVKFGDRDEILVFLKEETKESFDIIYKHSVAVERLALFISKQIDKSDDFIVMAGSLLHDIGRYRYPPKKADAILHGLFGYNLLIEKGVSEDIALIARNHIGAGIKKDDIIKQKLPLPLDDYIPNTIEQQIVAYADNRLRYSIIEDVWYPIVRFTKSLGIDYGKRVVDLHNRLIDLGFKNEFNINNKQIRTSKILEDEFYKRCNINTI